MNQPPNAGSRRTAIIGSVVVAILIVVVLAGFAISVPVTSAIPVQVESITSTVNYYTTSSQTVVQVNTASSTTAQVFSIPQTTLNCNKYTYSSASLSPGMDVQVTWSASNTVIAYVFNSAQYAAFAQSGTTANIVGGSGQPASGSLSFAVSASDTYYFVLGNTGGLFCLGVSPIGIYDGAGTASYLQQGTVGITQTNTYIVTTTVPYTVTYTTTSTLTCSYAFWHYLAGSNSCTQ